MLGEILVVVSSFLSLGLAVPLEPGQPGLPWSDEEISIVRAKVSVNLDILFTKLFNHFCQALQVMRMMDCQVEASYYK